MKKKNKNEIDNGTGKWRVVTIFMIICLFIGSSTPLKAQCEANNDAFQSGESLVYDLYFNWKFIWVKAGDARMNIFSIPYKSKPAYRTTLFAISNKRADKFFKMRDTLTCTMSDKLEPLYFRKGAEEGKHYTVDEVWFSYKDGVSYVNQKRVKKDGTVYISEDSDSRCVYDMLSILAQARSFNADDYKVGDRINFPMATGRRIEEQILIFRGRENFEANNDTTYRCLVFSLVEMKGKKEKEVITFYITDDKNHLPVRLDMFLNFGSAKAFLKGIHGNKYPLSSVIQGKR